MKIEQILSGIESAEGKLATREAIDSPVIISAHMYRLGQYTSALEKYLGDCEKEFEVLWAERYTYYLVDHLPKPLSATAAKQMADVDTSEQKGQIKKLTRYVSSSWRNQTGAMARINHLEAQAKNGGI